MRLRSSFITSGPCAVALVAAALLTWVCSSARAVPIPLAPGGTVVTTQSAPPGGAALLASNSQNFASQDMPLNPNGTSYTGSLTSNVFTNYPGSPFGPGFLTFTYKLSNNGPDSLHRLTTTNFAGYLVDVEHDAISSPGIVSSSVDRDLSGKIVGWNYDVNPRLPAGTSTALLIVHTNATQYVPSLASTINSATAGVLSYGPAPIPEPAALGALAGAVAVAGLARGRRKN
jgi:hypothetical protein